MKNNPIAIFFGFDERFAKYAAVSMLSLIDNRDRKRKYHIHVLHTDLKEETIKAISRLEQKGVRIFFDDMNEDISKLIAHLPIRDYYSPSTYFRLFIAEKFPQYDKALYVDSDTAILGDISKLFDTQLSHDYVAAVPEAVMQEMEPTGQYAEKVLGIQRNHYFNAGILLINSKKWREVKVLQQFIDLVHFYDFTIAQDQDYLNVICKGKVRLLPRKWNMECIRPWSIREKDRQIIHYAFAAKPWHDVTCPYSLYFWEYAAASPFYYDIKRQFADYTNEQLDAEKQVASSVMAACEKEIARPDNYLKKLESENEKERLADELNNGLIAA
ncbi:MAG: glycosyltransferase family 8 protein [Bacilli bacterium]|nr:glycosyltransferase family 8 protein [Bacilli bacterium]